MVNVTSVGQLLRQEKDEASPFACRARDSLNAFILRFAGMKVFLSSSLAGLPTGNLRH